MATYDYTPMPLPALTSDPAPHSQPPRGEQLGMSQYSPYKFEPPARAGDSRPIDFLRPRSPQHEFVLRYLLQRLEWSEQKMAQFGPRWRANEMRLQGYVTLPKYDDLIKKMKDTGRVAAPDEIVVPYAWATQSTIVTYLLHTFGGRKPIFQVGAYRGEQVKKAKSMETLLQYNADYTRYIYHLYNYFMNGEAYGVAIQRQMWTREERTRSVNRPVSAELSQVLSLNGINAPTYRAQERAVSFEGNGICVLSPFMFFPDPRVPMVEVAKKGEFVFWRDFQGRHMLLRAQAAGQLKWVEAARRAGTPNWMGGTYGGDSVAGLRSLGDNLTSGGHYGASDPAIAPNEQVDQGTVEIIPRELGLGEGSTPEKWLFTIVNKSQIVQAEPVNLNHGEHPVSVTEPNAFGHSFGQLATTDFLAPIQDLMSWLVNSHMYNVRASLNNIFAVDPNRVEIDDFLDPLPGGLIRLKSTPWAPANVRDSIQQFPVADVTRSHLSDFQLVNRLGNDLTGASDNLRGIQDSGGRKTATEVRTSFEAGGSRLASRAMLYSAMGLSAGASQWASNYQQFLSAPFEARVLGQEGLMNSVRITPDDIEGDFFFPINDGTLPLDKVATLEVWKDIWLGIINDPTGQLRQEYNTGAIFRFMAQLGGAQNIDEFRTTVASPGQIDQQAQAGNLVPLNALPGGPPSGMPPMPGLPPAGGSGLPMLPPPPQEF